MRRPISSKSHTCTEEVYVDVAGISAKADAHYPGRSVGLPKGYHGYESIGRAGRSQQRAYCVLGSVQIRRAKVPPAPE